MMMLATAMALAIAADVPAEGETVAPPLERGYVQMCHAKPPVPAAALTERAANRAIVRAVRAAFNREWPHYRPPANMAAVDVAVRNFQNYAYKGPSAPQSLQEFNETGGEIVALQVQARAGRSWVRADLNKDGHVIELKTLLAADVEMPIRFAQYMAAYMLLNDLLASDATVPRQGCIAEAQFQLAFGLARIATRRFGVMPPRSFRRSFREWERYRL